MRAPDLFKTAAAVLLAFIAASLFSATAQANEAFYQVTNVASDDVLNIRASAGTQQAVIGTIPANGKTILGTGRNTQVGSSNWAEIVWLGQIGWVNDFYLTTDIAPGAQVNTQYQQSDQNATGSANTHTHAANRCTRSVSHTHPNGSNSHQHNYNCDQGQQLAQPTGQQNAQTHSHPANPCTNSVTHTHGNGDNAHEHRYNCQTQQMARPKYNPQPKYTQY